MSFNEFEPFMSQRYRSRLPVSFDNSLDLYEQIISVIEYFNLVIENSNKVTNEIISLRKEFIQFKKDIENNLMPENIKIVLTEWLNNGKLASIIDSVLNTQLDDFKEEVNNEIVSFNEQLIKLKNGKIGGGIKAEPEDLSERTLSLLTGDGVINLETIPQDYSVTEKKTTFISVSSNLLSVDFFTDGFTTNTANGELQPNILYSVSKFIKLPKNTVFSTNSKILKVSRYDSNGKYINSADNPTTFNTYEGTLFKFVVRAIDYSIVQLNQGETLLTYEPFYKELDRDINVNLSNDSVNTPQLVDKSVTKEKTDYINISTNFLDTKDNMYMYSFDSVTGEPVANGNYRLSKPLKVEKNKSVFSRNIAKVGRFDKSGKLISVHTPNLSSDVWNTLEGEIIRVVMPVLSFKSSQLSYSKEEIPFEPFYEAQFDSSIKVSEDSIIKSGEEANNSDLWVADKFVVEGSTLLNYTATQTNITAQPLLDKLKTDELISLYNDLLQRFPQFVSRVSLGKDGSNKDIFSYTVKAKDVPTLYVSNDKIKAKPAKMILVSGVHGEEKAGAYCLYLAIRKMLEDWKTNEELETLLFNTHFIVVPVVNVYGFDNTQRKNENGIDLARNFPEGFIKVSSTEPTYGGETALSEKATQLIKKLIDDNKEAIYFGSFHNFVGDQFIWNAGATKLSVHLGRKLVSKLTRKWQKEYSWMPQSDYYVGYSDDGSPGGSESKYASKVGIQSSTFEVSAKMSKESSTAYTENSLRLGAETDINWLLLNLKENTEFYNKI